MLRARYKLELVFVHRFFQVHTSKMRLQSERVGWSDGSVGKSISFVSTELRGGNRQLLEACWPTCLAERNDWLRFRERPCLKGIKWRAIKTMSVLWASVCVCARAVLVFISVCLCQKIPCKLAFQEWFFCIDSYICLDPHDISSLCSKSFSSSLYRSGWPHT